jgi:transposase-like protein
MPRIIQLNESELKEQLKTLVRGSVEETLNAYLDAEADLITNAVKYERSVDRQDTRAGHYKRKLLTTSGEVELKIPKLRTLPFETAIIERYKRRESSVEESLIEMYLAGVSVRRIEDVTEALWGTKVSPGTISNLNRKAYAHIEEWRNRPLEREYPYVYLDGIYLKRNWGGSYENVSVLVALAVNDDGYREIIGAMEGGREDTASWEAFLRHLKGRGLQGVRLIVGDRCLGLVDAVSNTFSEAKYQRCIVHFYRNVFGVTPRKRVREVAAMLKAIHAQENKEAARHKAQLVIAALYATKLKEAAKTLESGLEETLSYMDFPPEHWLRIRTNNGLERIMREIRRRTRVVGAFPDGNSALMLVCARLRHISATQWGEKRYLNMKRFDEYDVPNELPDNTANKKTA